MTAREQGFLLLTSSLGDPLRKPLTFHQFRTLILRAKKLPAMREASTVTMENMAQMGYDQAMAERVVRLFSEKDRMAAYLRRAKKHGCSLVALTNPCYPAVLPERLDMDTPTVLWAKGDVSLLQKPAVALVGSRNLRLENLRFAREAGRQAARNGYVLVSGNARGADQEAQNACLEHGGQVISVVADSLADHRSDPNVLYLSEDSFDLDFSSRRALRRNRIIHSLGIITFVAQSDFGKGGTWDGTMKNLQKGYSPVYCFCDGSPAAEAFAHRGATPITIEQLPDHL